MTTLKHTFVKPDGALFMTNNEHVVVPDIMRCVDGSWEHNWYRADGHMACPACGVNWYVEEEA